MSLHETQVEIQAEYAARGDELGDRFIAESEHTDEPVAVAEIFAASVASARIVADTIQLELLYQELLDTVDKMIAKYKAFPAAYHIDIHHACPDRLFHINIKK